MSAKEGFSSEGLTVSHCEVLLYRCRQHNGGAQSLTVTFTSRSDVAHLCFENFFPHVDRRLKTEDFGVGHQPDSSKIDRSASKLVFSRVFLMFN